MNLAPCPFILPLFWVFQPSLIFQAVVADFGTQRGFQTISLVLVCGCIWKVSGVSFVPSSSVSMECFTLLLNLPAPPTQVLHTGERQGLPSLSLTHTPYTNTHTVLSRRDVLKTQIAFIAYICLHTVYIMEDNIIFFFCLNLTGLFREVETFSTVCKLAN